MSEHDEIIKLLKELIELVKTMPKEVQHYHYHYAGTGSYPITPFNPVVNVPLQHGFWLTTTERDTVV